MTQSDFVHIVMPLKDKVFRLAKRLLVSREEAEDATYCGDDRVALAPRGPFALARRRRRWLALALCIAGFGIAPVRHEAALATL